MAAYLVACYDITDEAGYAPYPAAVAPTLLPFEGELIAADFDSETMEGDARRVTVIVKFPSKAIAREWHASPAYRAVAPLRTDHTESSVVIVDGVSG
ncbi:DUF1330 domain-containing protein [Altererythrobacter sp. BO-6]|uniref:DUF1330 domain-containing protein n=1 Tax=Altererythrobacter sp. BO-6 TaxID=2604537 RepID=UPI0013E10A16|nr:DUF1330 domain-containing protein [Altererythrobacter sp. BO-6]QIG53887.1 DUF1330 domain-containing protein [Altererythrobacter sp. BO-6]